MHILKIVVWIRMDSVYQQNGIISLGFITFVSFGKSKTNSIHKVFTHQLDTNIGNAFRRNQNVIIRCSLKKSISTMFTIIHYSTCLENVCSMSQLHDIDGATHDLHLVITVVFVINTITHQIGILIVISIYVIISTVIYCNSWYRSTNTLNLFLFYLIANNIDNINLIISIYEISMMIDTINGILIRELNTQIHTGYINKIRVIMIIHYDDVDVSICKTNNYRTNTIIINKTDMTINAIDASVVFFAIIHKILLVDIIYSKSPVLILKDDGIILACLEFVATVQNYGGGTIGKTSMPLGISNCVQTVVSVINGKESECFYTLKSLGYRADGIDTIDPDTVQIDVWHT